MSVTFQRAQPCSKCGSHEFYILSRLCKPCRCETTKAYQQKNKEKCRANQAAWRAKNAEYRRLKTIARRECVREVKLTFACLLLAGGKV